MRDSFIGVLEIGRFFTCHINREVEPPEKSAAVLCDSAF